MNKKIKKRRKLILAVETVRLLETGELKLAFSGSDPFSQTENACKPV